VSLADDLLAWAGPEANGEAELLAILAKHVTQAECDARLLAHAYTTDSRPPQHVVDRALAYRAGRPG
jgi:hypothetical protein